MNPEWFYSEGDIRKGPVTIDELKRLYHDGQLQPTDLVWKAGMPDWVEVRTITEIVGLTFTQRPTGGSTADEDEWDRPNRRRSSVGDAWGDADDDDDRPRTRRERDRAERRRRRAEDDHPGDDEVADYDDAPRRRSRTGGSRRQPQQIQTIGTMLLIGGILGIITVLGVGVVFFPCCIWPGFWLELVWAIMAIIRGSSMMSYDTQGPPRTLAILQILMILNGDVINCILGVVVLNQLSEPDVSAHYRRQGYY